MGEAGTLAVAWLGVDEADGRACGLGRHLHRCQEIPGPCPIFYAGSPLAVDFGEQDNDPSVPIVTAAAIRVPPGVAGLTDRITAADQQVAAREKQAADAADAEDEAERARDTLPDKTHVETLARGYKQQRTLKHWSAVVAGT